MWAYDPDIVVLAMFTANDVSDNHRAIRREDNVPYFVYEGDELVLDASFLDSRGYQMRRHWTARALVSASRFSRAVQLANQARLSRGFRQRQEELIEAAGDETIVELGLDNLVYQDPPDPLWEEAWRVTEGILSMMDREVREMGAQFAIVTLSNGIQVHPDPSDRVKLEEQLQVEDLFYPDARIKAFGERHGIPVLNLAPHLQEYAVARGVFLHGFDEQLGSGHWNAEGHRLAGELIGSWVAESVIP